MPAETYNRLLMWSSSFLDRYFRQSNQAIDVSLNDNYRIFIDCLKTTSLNKSWPLASIALPETRRRVTYGLEKRKQESGCRNKPSQALFDCGEPQTMIHLLSVFLHTRRPIDIYFKSPKCGRLLIELNLTQSTTCFCIVLWLHCIVLIRHGFVIWSCYYTMFVRWLCKYVVCLKNILLKKRQPSITTVWNFQCMSIFLYNFK